MQCKMCITAFEGRGCVCVQQCTLCTETAVLVRTDGRSHRLDPSLSYVCKPLRRAVVPHLQPVHILYGASASPNITHTGDSNSTNNPEVCIDSDELQDHVQQVNHSEPWLPPSRF